MAIVRQKLSASTNGRNVKVTGTNTAGAVTIHTADATALDQVTLFAVNTSASTVTLTIEWGGTTSPDDLVVVDLPANSGDRTIVDGRVLTGGLLVEAFASTASVVTINGFVDRIT